MGRPKLRTLGVGKMTYCKSGKETGLNTRFASVYATATYTQKGLQMAVIIASAIAGEPQRNSGSVYLEARPGTCEQLRDRNYDPCTTMTTITAK